MGKSRWYKIGHRLARPTAATCRTGTMIWQKSLGESLAYKLWSDWGIGNRWGGCWSQDMGDEGTRGSWVGGWGELGGREREAWGHLVGRWRVAGDRSIKRNEQKVMTFFMCRRLTADVKILPMLQCIKRNKSMMHELNDDYLHSHTIAIFWFGYLFLWLSYSMLQFATSQNPTVYFFSSLFLLQISWCLDSMVKTWSSL